jgi:hypothetical protein
MKQLFIIFLLNLSISGNIFAQAERTSTSTGFIELSSLIEKEFNKANTFIISNNINVSFDLKFDSLNRFMLSNSSAHNSKEALAFNKFLKEYDEKTGILSQYPLFSDSTLSYNITTFMDAELQRIWSTHISTRPKSTTLYDPEIDYHHILQPQVQKGFKNFLNYLVTAIKNKNLEHLFLPLDTSYLSFIITEDGSAIDAKVNGTSNTDVQTIMENSGKWLPGYTQGWFTYTFFNIQINKSINGTIPPNIEMVAKVTETESIVRLLTDTSYKGHLILIESLNKTTLTNNEDLIVSFIYQTGLPQILGPTIITGSKRKGKKILKLINKNISKIGPKEFRRPSRFYINVDDNKSFRNP